MLPINPDKLRRPRIEVEYIHASITIPTVEDTPQSSLAHVNTYEVSSHEGAYRVWIDEFRDAEGSQFLLLRMNVNPSAFDHEIADKLMSEWKLFRSCTDAPIYAIEPSANEPGWEQFVSIFGFEPLTVIDWFDGKRLMTVSEAG